MARRARHAALLILLLAAAGGALSRPHARQAPVPFADRTAASGLDFHHVNGATGELLLPEVIGAGGALFDADNDGDLDVLAVQSGSLRPAGDRRPRTRLFRNDTVAGRDRWPRFTDVTEASGIVVTGYGMGAAAGDIDDDGWTDLYITTLGPNRMFRNNGDGTFTDVTARSGTDDARWSTSATFVDYDRDGRLDLFVANYVAFAPDMTRECFSAGSARDYCNPVVYPPVTDSLFRNAGDGTFVNVSTRAGFAGAPARGLGVLAGDVNEDGWTDLYVANDGDPNQLWINQRGSGVFREDALLAGVAVNRMGQAQGSMGIDLADVDADGDHDLFVTNLDNEGNTFYRNVGGGLFEDRTVEAGLFRLGFTGFGTRFLDYDNDGWLDLVIVNGAVRHLARQAQARDPYPLKQRSQLFRNEAGRRFVEVTGSAGPPFAVEQVARGAATGDLDNDGDVDLIVFNNSGPARLLVNETGAARHWLGVRVMAASRPRDALAASVELVLPGGRRRVRRVQADGSYLVSNDPRVLFGLGADGAPQTIRVRWPAGQVEEFRGLAADRYWLVEPGKAARAP